MTIYYVMIPFRFDALDSKFPPPSFFWKDVKQGQKLNKDVKEIIDKNNGNEEDSKSKKKMGENVKEEVREKIIGKKLKTLKLQVLRMPSGFTWEKTWKH